MKSLAEVTWCASLFRKISEAVGDEQVGFGAGLWGEKAAEGSSGRLHPQSRWWWGGSEPWPGPRIQHWGNKMSICRTSEARWQQAEAVGATIWALLNLRYLQTFVPQWKVCGLLDMRWSSERGPC